LEKVEPLSRLGYRREGSVQERVVPDPLDPCCYFGVKVLFFFQAVCS
jgi:hypothetical protein